MESMDTWSQSYICKWWIFQKFVYNSDEYSRMGFTERYESDSDSEDYSTENYTTSSDDDCDSNNLIR